MKDMPRVRISFYLVGENFDLDSITSKMGIQPTETRTRESFKLPKFSCTEWSLEVAMSKCKAVSIVFAQVVEMLVGKQELICNICEQNNLKAGFVVMIDMDNDEIAEIILPPEIVSFAASINAEIGFDIFHFG